MARTRIRSTLYPGLTRFALVLAGLGAMLCLESSASACSVRFEVSADLPPGFSTPSVECTGPYLRQSSCTSVAPDTQDKEFYCADQDVLATLNGDWTCTAFVDDDCNTCAGDCKKTNFKISNERPNPVELTVSDDNGIPAISSSSSSSCECMESTSTLGNHSGSEIDRDTWEVAANVGERFLVRLEANRSFGHTGKTAEVIVRSARGRVIDRESGPLPLDLDVAAVGRELVVTVKGELHADAPFRGRYRLIVTPDGEVDRRVLAPQRNVEF